MIINSKAELDASIRELENKKSIQEVELIRQFKATRESLAPLNLIKNGISNITKPVLESKLLKATAGLGGTVVNKIKKLGMSVYNKFFKKNNVHLNNKLTG